MAHFFVHFIDAQIEIHNFLYLRPLVSHLP